MAKKSKKPRCRIARPLRDRLDRWLKFVERQTFRELDRLVIHSDDRPLLRGQRQYEGLPIVTLDELQQERCQPCTN